MTATRQPRIRRPSWARTVTRRALRTLRHVHAEIALASEAMARPGRAPQPRPAASSAPADGYSESAGRQPLAAATAKGTKRTA